MVIKKKETNKKLTMEQLIAKADAAKKANPLDLSSDQDLSIALMNLVALEEHFFFSGAKTKKPGFYDLINVVRDMRKDLMCRIVKQSSAINGEVWCLSKHLLAASMRLMEVGTKALSAGKKEDAVNLFGKAYDLYSLFWGINMDLIDLSKVQKDESIDKNLAAWIGEKSSDKDSDDKNQNASGLGKDSKTSTKDGKTGTLENETGTFDLSGSVGEKKHGLLFGLGEWVKKSVNCCLE